MTVQSPLRRAVLALGIVCLWLTNHACNTDLEILISQFLNQVNCPIVVNEPPSDVTLDYDQRWAEIEMETVVWPDGVCRGFSDGCPCSDFYYNTGLCENGETLYIHRTDFMFVEVSYYDVNTRAYVGGRFEPESPMGCGRIIYLREIDCPLASTDASRCTPHVAP